MIGPNIIVIGGSCSGKSTLAAELARRLDLRFVELDALFWEPNWVEAEREVFHERVAEATRGDGWVVAGNYSSSMPITWTRAHDVVWLDFRLGLLLRRIIRRSWRRARTKELLWGTNRERFWPQFQPNDDSLIWFTARHYHSRRRRVEAWMTGRDYPQVNWTRLRGPRDVSEWLAGQEVGSIERPVASEA